MDVNSTRFRKLKSTKNPYYASDKTSFYLKACTFNCAVCMEEGFLFQFHVG